MKILTHVPDEALRLLRRSLPEDELVTVPREGDLPEGLTGEALVTVRQAWPNLVPAVESSGVRWIQILGTGVNGFPAEITEGRPFTCCRGATGSSMAEWSMAMMLAFEKHVPDVWLTSRPERTHMVDIGSLRESTVGLVGFGAIGRALARMLEPFGARVLATRRTDAPFGVESVQRASLERILQESDHLVLCLPSTPATAGLLDKRAFARMKAGVHLVNVARGELIDEAALLGALDNGTVARASLDATVPEPLPEGHWMYADPRVRLSPHCSWSSPYALGELVARVVGNVEAWKCGRELSGLLDVEQGY